MANMNFGASLMLFIPIRLLGPSLTQCYFLSPFCVCYNHWYNSFGTYLPHIVYHEDSSKVSWFFHIYGNSCYRAPSHNGLYHDAHILRLFYCRLDKIIHLLLSRAKFIRLIKSLTYLWLLICVWDDSGEFSLQQLDV